MLFDLLNLPYHDLVQIFIHLFISLHLGTGQCHGVCVFLLCHVQIRDICL